MLAPTAGSFINTWCDLMNSPHLLNSQPRWRYRATQSRHLYMLSQTHRPDSYWRRCLAKMQYSQYPLLLKRKPVNIYTAGSLYTYTYRHTHILVRDPLRFTRIQHIQHIHYIELSRPIPIQRGHYIHSELTVENRGRNHSRLVEDRWK